MPLPTRRQAAVAVLALTALLAGCSGLSDDDPDIPDGDEAAERLSSVTVYNQTLITQSTVGNETGEEVRVERTVRPATGEQYQVTRRDGNRTVVVSNGTTRWLYQPVTNRVTRTQLEDTTQFRNAEQLRDLVNSLETDDTAESSVAPVVPIFASGESASAGSFNVTGYSEPVVTEYRGVETVSGRDTYVIRLESPNSSDRQIQQTLYYDTESFLLMGAEYSLTTGDSHIHGEMRVQNLTLNPSVGNSTFEFDPPDSATVVTNEFQRYQNRSELRRASRVQTPDPSVPEGFDFESGTVFKQNVSLRYTSGPANIFVARTDTDSLHDDSEQVDYRGRTYFLAEEHGRTALHWRCDDSVYSVRGRLDRDTLLGVGDSIECPATTGG